MGERGRAVGAREHLVLVGMMGAGKSTLGRALAEHLGLPLLDSDVQIEEQHGRDGAAIARDQGVDALHALEQAVLRRTLAAAEPVVVTAAASVVTDARCRAELAKVPVVWLDAPVEELVARAAGGTHRRRVDLAAAARLANDRRELFAEVADLRLDARRPTEELLDEVLTFLRARSRPW